MSWSCVWLFRDCVVLLRLMLCSVVFSGVVVGVCHVVLSYVPLLCGLLCCVLCSGCVLGCVGLVLCRGVSSLRFVVLRCVVCYDVNV